MFFYFNSFLWGIVLGSPFAPLLLPFLPKCMQLEPLIFLLAFTPNNLMPQEEYNIFFEYSNYFLMSFIPLVIIFALGSVWTLNST